MLGIGAKSKEEKGMIGSTEMPATLVASARADVSDGPVAFFLFNRTRRPHLFLQRCARNGRWWYHDLD